MRIVALIHSRAKLLCETVCKAPHQGPRSGSGGKVAITIRTSLDAAAGRSGTPWGLRQRQPDSSTDCEGTHRPDRHVCEGGDGGLEKVDHQRVKVEHRIIPLSGQNPS